MDSDLVALCKEIIAGVRTYFRPGEREREVCDIYLNRRAEKAEGGEDAPLPANASEAQKVWRRTVSFFRDAYARGEASEYFPVMDGLMDKTLGVNMEDMSGQTG